MSKRIILNTLLCLYLAGGQNRVIVFDSWQDSLRFVLRDIMSNKQSCKLEKPPKPKYFYKIEVDDGDGSLVLCGTFVDDKWKIIDVNWKELKSSFEEHNFWALRKKLIDMPERIDPRSQYVLRDWLHFPGDLKNAEFRKLEGRTTTDILDEILNKDMTDLPKGEYGQPGLFKVQIFTPNARDMSNLYAVVSVDEDGSFSFMHFDVTRQIEAKRDLKMLQSDGNLTAAARARAIRRLERNDEYKNIDARIYTSEFSSNFEIKNYKADSIKPVPDFFERLRICRLSTRPSFRKSNLGLLCQFIFDKPYSRNVDIDEFEVEQSSRDTNCWPSSFFSASYEEGTLYVRYNSLSELEVLDPNNGNLEKLRQVFKKTIDGRALNVSDFWAPCPINFEEAKQYLFPNIISSNPSESEEECLAK